MMIALRHLPVAQPTVLSVKSKLFHECLKILGCIPEENAIGSGNAQEAVKIQDPIEDMFVMLRVRFKLPPKAIQVC